MVTCLAEDVGQLQLHGDSSLKSGGLETKLGRRSRPADGRQLVEVAGENDLEACDASGKAKGHENARENGR